MKNIVTRQMSRWVGILLPVACACSSMQVQTAKDPQANLAQYKTYAFAPQPAQNPGRPNASILDETVKSSVEQNLVSKGLVPAKGSQPDLLISYYGISRNKVTYGVAPGYPYEGYYSGRYYSEPFVTREGSLTLQFIDPRTKRVVWQGTAADTISEAGPSQDQIAKAVNTLIEKYPVV